MRVCVCGRILRRLRGHPQYVRGLPVASLFALSDARSALEPGRVAELASLYMHS